MRDLSAVDRVSTEGTADRVAGHDGVPTDPGSASPCIIAVQHRRAASPGRDRVRIDRSFRKCGWVRGMVAPPRPPFSPGSSSLERERDESGRPRRGTSHRGIGPRTHDSDATGSPGLRTDFVRIGFRGDGPGEELRGERSSSVPILPVGRRSHYRANVRNARRAEHRCSPRGQRRFEEGVSRPARARSSSSIRIFNSTIRRG